MKDELIGKQFGYLTVLQKVESKKYSNGSSQTCYKCLCVCGNKPIVTKNHLKTGHTKSCGCMKGKMCSDTQIKHGQTGTRLYQTYQHMKKRCYKPSQKEYHRYGGRGISICDEWLGENGFENFYNWAISNGYQENLTIDRINNDGNYEPSNCRWATHEEQMNNVSYNVRVTHNGETHTIAEWAKMLGLKQDTIQARLKYYGFSIEDALFKTPTCKKQVAVYLGNDLINIFDSQKEAADFIGTDKSTMSMYLNGKLQSLPNGYKAHRVEMQKNIITR